ncbi:alpha/beta hydrolase [Pseudalkalibacillus hwajinpoensis]|uniref:alpha/beta hydrolase n=1 Tax=Guptibacillus hwajinpoensis TaxID=208199 RepID=UPI00325AC4BC
MKKRYYTRLLNETITIYEESGSLKAYQHIKKYADDVEGNRAQLYNFKYALAAASGLEKEALAILKEAVIDHGYWYAYEYLQADEDLNSLRKYEEFKELVQLCKQREEEAKQAVKPELQVVEGNGSSILIALHGDQENAEITEPYWNLAVSEGYTLALPQSSQIQFSEAFEWDDLDQAVDEVVAHDQRLEMKEDLGGHKIIGGFSAGCRVALKTVLEKGLSVSGFLFVAPWLPEIDEWSELLNNLKGMNIRGYIICGDQDEDCLEGSSRLAELLKSKGILHQLKVVRGLDHEYPENFNEMLLDGLTYLEAAK